jgi:hypothetical protein
MNCLFLKKYRKNGYFILAATYLYIAGCSGSIVTKSFRVITEPPDAVITVASSIEQHKNKYTSPAVIAVDVPSDSTITAKSYLTVTKSNFKPVVIPLRHISTGDSIKIKLDKIVAPFQKEYSTSANTGSDVSRLRYRLLSPAMSDNLKSQLGTRSLTSTLSDEIKFVDQIVSISFLVSRQSFEMRLTNLSRYPLKILWDRAEYRDIHARCSRLMHSGIRYQDRHNPIPDQIIIPSASVQEIITPVKNVHVSSPGRGYEINPLFDGESAGLAGLYEKVFDLFIPIEINRSIVPYNFKIQILDPSSMSVKI